MITRAERTRPRRRDHYAGHTLYEDVGWKPRASGTIVGSFVKLHRLARRGGIQAKLDWVLDAKNLREVARDY